MQKRAKKVWIWRKKVEDEWRIMPVSRHPPLIYSLDYMMFNTKKWKVEDEIKKI